jgi:hypothetical protein
MEARREGGRDPARGNPGICCVGSYIFFFLILLLHYTSHNLSADIQDSSSFKWKWGMTIFPHVSCSNWRVGGSTERPAPGLAFPLLSFYFFCCCCLITTIQDLVYFTSFWLYPFFLNDFLPPPSYAPRHPRHLATPSPSLITQNSTGKISHPEK